MSNAAFKRDFTRLLERAGEKAADVVRKSITDVQSALIFKSPVDTGAFRNNWNTALGAIDASNSRQADKSGAGATAQTADAVSRYRLGDRIFITNSMPYAMRLEYGWSDQAPQGMVRITSVEFAQYLRRQVAKL